jgi:periplasmic protein TonB
LPDGLGRALAISLLFHLLLLWPSPPAWQEAVPPAPLTAVLRPSAAPIPPAAATVVYEPSLRPTWARRQELISTRTLAVKDESPLPAIATSDLTVATAARSEPGLTAAAPALSALPPGDGVDADGLRSYRLALAREARHHKRYPPQAIDAGWGGTAEVRVMVPVPGAAQVAELTKSSGHAVLDQAALEMLRQALPATPIPPGLQGRKFAVYLPVVFELPE